MTDTGLSICIVLYRGDEVVRQFHRELTQSLVGLPDVEVLYYDNSPDDTLADAVSSPERADVSYRHDARNLGFSYANNQLILRCRHSRILLLNPDVFGFSPNFWDRLKMLPLANEVRFAKLLNRDGSFQDCVGEPVGLLRPFSKAPDYNAMMRPTGVGMGIMAFMLTTRDVISRVGLLDCDYRLYAEDMDWCHRAARAGVAIVYDPTLVLTHLGGVSAGDRWSHRVSLKRKYAAEITFIDKHFCGLHWAAMRCLNSLKRIVRAR